MQQRKAMHHIFLHTNVAANGLLGFLLKDCPAFRELILSYTLGPTDCAEFVPCALVVDQGGTAKAKQNFLVTNMGHTSQNVHGKDARNVTIGTYELALVRTIHSDFSALQLPPCNISFGRAVHTNIDASTALDADSILQYATCSALLFLCIRIAEGPHNIPGESDD